ncbi:ShlB/FhaC/HecB family hemolysin secretion/activation protein [Bradyrhizobium sp. CSA112]|uniref:ShlB/FhaC/HecB family hemolysin secretion/activation protein n=1 Tax=Bradyrhizobium sp. CSA112 TaxID=2699170 RepID=UPI0023AE969D|nr:ShlB/FhaC/HecB family hemolysin secretion/activation protein [Bradyrhizobium sp. CSA112]MDE5457040.1 ShlB/FhaC/HecB family hemolysin secretion/activation protein [Bradyrhizobium sp. CSA112]
MPAGRALLCLTAGAVTLAGGLVAANPACAAKAASAERAPNATSSSSAAEQASSQKPVAPAQRFDIYDFAVQGAETLPQIEIEEAIYPFLGPNKTADDVEKARAALEKAYHDKGYQTVSVSVPQQNALGKMITLKVTELKVGRLRVKNSRYFRLDRITSKAGSLKEGTVPNFGEVTKDIVALNQWPDRRVTPALRAGVTPGTVDVDLNVEDKAPLHASVELNNRQSPNTTALRVSSTVHYDNLWQLGHSLSFTYQVAPQRPGDAEVFSGSYLARVQDVDWLNVLFYAVKSSSDVATVGGTNVIGPGQIFGSRAVITLPARENFFHTLSAGVDYKHFDQTVKLGGEGFSSPVTYYPVVANYSATFQGEKSTTQLNAGVTYNLRPLSDDWVTFDNKRYYASPSFTHLNVDVSHTHELPEGFQLYGKVQGQVADGPLVSSEQFSAGGLDTVRGYLESETLGDNGVVGNIELRSPNIGELLQKQMKDETGQGQARFTIFDEWRFFGFADAGTVTTLKPLPEQQSKFDVWSYGVGARFKMFNYLNGTLVYSVPMVSQAYTEARNPRVNFRIWGEF